MDHFHRGVHVAQRQGNQCAGDPHVGVGKRIGVRAGEAAGGHALQRDLLVFGGVDDALEQVVLDGRSVSDAGAFAGGNVALLDLVHHRRLRTVRDVGHDGHVRLDALGDHLGAAQADFLLDAVGDVQAKGKLDLVLVQHPGDFGNHEAAGAVVEGTADVPLLVEQHVLVLVGHDAADMDAHGFHFGLVLGADVEEDVLEGRRGLLAGGAGVDGRPAEDGLHRAVLGVDVHALGRGDLVVAAPVAAQVDEAVIGDVVDKPTDFVGVGLDDHLVLRLRIDDAHHSAVSVDNVIVDVGRDVVEPELLSPAFKAGWGWVVEVSLQELLRGAGDDLLLGHCEVEIRGRAAPSPVRGGQNVPTAGVDIFGRPRDERIRVIPFC